jgi:hypothetical protein
MYSRNVCTGLLAAKHHAMQVMVFTSPSRLCQLTPYKMGTMSALFEIDKLDAQSEAPVLRVSITRRSANVIERIVSPIKNEDIVFIKHWASESSLQIKTIGKGSKQLFSWR